MRADRSTCQSRRDGFVAPVRALGSTRDLGLPRDALYAPDDSGAERFLSLLNSWIEMTMVLNELARSMGQPDFYPFVMSKPTVAKLRFVHLVVQDARSATTAS